MGGFSYDRDVHGSSSYSNWGTSSISQSKLAAKTLNSSMKANNKIIRSMSKNPIIIVLDVTGSNINFARLVYDKMPMFYGQIEQKKYLEDFDIAFLAIGDKRMGDDYPLQVSDFAKGIEIDSWMEKLVLESGGGGNKRESYELAAHYLNECCQFNKDASPIVIFIGDEMAYNEVIEKDCRDTEIPFHEEYDPFPQLKEKFNNNVFMMLNKYCGERFADDITNFWKQKLSPEHTIMIKEEKSIVDLMLGVIALRNNRNLKMIESDMISRGQTIQRLKNVKEALLELSNCTDITTINTNISLVKTLNSKGLGKRL